MKPRTTGPNRTAQTASRRTRAVHAAVGFAWVVTNQSRLTSHDQSWMMDVKQTTDYSSLKLVAVDHCKFQRAPNELPVLSCPFLPLLRAAWFFFIGGFLFGLVHAARWLPLHPVHNQSPCGGHPGRGIGSTLWSPDQIGCNLSGCNRTLHEIVLGFLVPSDNAIRRSQIV